MRINACAFIMVTILASATDAHADPRATLELTTPQTTINAVETWQFRLVLRNTGDVPIPVIPHRHRFFGRQMFADLERRKNVVIPEVTDLEGGISTEPDWRTATWEAVQERNPPLLAPGEHIELTHVNYDFRLCPDSPDRSILWDLRARRQLEWRDPPPGRLVFPGEPKTP